MSKKNIIIFVILLLILIILLIYFAFFRPSNDEVNVYDYYEGEQREDVPKFDSLSI